MTYRAVETLAEVDLILAEDTRHSKKLLTHYAISTPVASLHEHNESKKAMGVVKEIQQGKRVALISDAGTPLISDPGFVLVRQCRESEVPVWCVPGASSIIAALSIAGVSAASFLFEGFLSAKASARQTQLSKLRQEQRTIVLLESSHRIQALVDDIAHEFGDGALLVLGRELTKRYEQVYRGTPKEIAQELRDNESARKGEFVVMIEPEPITESDKQEIDLDQLLTKLMVHVSLKQASKIAADITGVGKNELYQRALHLQDDS